MRQNGNTMSDITTTPAFTTRVQKSFLIVEFRRESLMAQQVIKDVQAQLYALLDEDEHNNVVFNLSRVRDISSTFLGTIIAIHTRLSKRRGKLVLVGLSDKLSELMQLTRLDRVINILPTVNDALGRDAFL
jgi:anti-sigma B factor antagonist